MKRSLTIVLIICSLFLPMLILFAREANGASDQALARRNSRRRKLRNRRSQRTRLKSAPATAAATQQKALDPSGQPAEQIAEPEEYRLGDPRANRPRTRRPPPRKPIPDLSNPSAPPPPPVE